MRGRLGAVVLAALLAAGCAGSPAWYSVKISETREEAERNAKKMAELRLGQSRQDVLGLMGPPAKTEAYRTAEGKSVEFLFYRTKGWDANPWAAAYGGEKVADKDDQFTPVALEADAVIGWGRRFYTDMAGPRASPQ
jgi:hypothetical protein